MELACECGTRHDIVFALGMITGGALMLGIFLLIAATAG